MSIRRWLVLLAVLDCLLPIGVSLAQEEPALRLNLSDSSRTILWVVIPILLLSLGGRLVSSWIANRGRVPTNQPAVTGPFGGTLCPKCGRPFAMHIWGFNVVVGKYDRCPHCGKWSLVRRVHPDILRNAAEAFMADETGEETAVPSPPAATDSFSKQLDDSRFDNS